MMYFSFLSESYIPRSTVGSGYGRLVGSGLGGILGGIGAGLLGHAISGDSGDSYLSLSTLAPAAAGALGGLLGGNVLGGRIGSKMISNPNAPADFNKMSHRLGYLEDETSKIVPSDLLSSFNVKKRQAEALRRMGYDDLTIHAAINPGYNKNGRPNVTPYTVVLTKPNQQVVNK